MKVSLVVNSFETRFNFILTVSLHRKNIVQWKNHTNKQTKQQNGTNKTKTKNKQNNNNDYVKQ